MFSLNHLFLTGLLGAAAPGNTGVPAMGLAEALSFARAHAPTLLASRAQVDAAREAADVPRARWLPSAGATAQLIAGTANNTTSLTFAGAGAPLPRIGNTPFNPALSWGDSASYQPYASSLVGVGFVQQLFDFGLTAARIAATDATLAARTQDLRQQDLDLTFAVTVAFVGVLAAHDVERAAAASVEREQAIRDQAAALVAGQLRSEIYLDRAEAQLARGQVDLTRATAGVTAAQAELAIAIGYGGPLLEASGPGPSASPQPSIDDAVSQAESRSPEVQSLQLQLEAQREQARAIRDLTHPDLSLTGALSGRSGGAPASGGATPRFDGFLPETPNWDVGLVLSWSFLDPVTFAQARAAEARETVFRAETDAARERVRGATERVWTFADAAAKTLPLLSRARDAAVADERQATTRFSQGLGTSVEVADAEALLTSAEVQLAEGNFDLARARANLDRLLAGGE